MSGRKVWQAKVLAEHPELRPATERGQLAREQPRDERKARSVMPEFQINENTDQLAGWLAALLPASQAVTGMQLHMAPQLHEILIRAGWHEPDNESNHESAGGGDQHE